MSKTITADRLLITARGAAADASRLLLDGYRTRPAATEKGWADLVTEYDLKSEKLIRERLGRDTPDVAIVGEEQGGTPGELTWYLDPLDGTMNFVHGHPFFCVSIGAADKDGPLVGAVIAPALGIEWWGGRDEGAFRNAEPCHVSATSTLRDALLSTGFPVDSAKAKDDNLDTFSNVTKRVQGVRRCGSAAIDCCLVADGTYDGYWERELKAWDTIAGCAIALGAGGKLTSLDGGPAELAVGHLVLSNGKIHDALVELVRR